MLSSRRLAATPERLCSAPLRARPASGIAARSPAGSLSSPKGLALALRFPAPLRTSNSLLAKFAVPGSAVSRSLKTARRPLLIAPRFWAEFLKARSLFGSRPLRALLITPRLWAEFLEARSFSGSCLLVLIGG